MWVVGVPRRVILTCSLECIAGVKPIAPSVSLLTCSNNNNNNRSATGRPLHFLLGQQLLAQLVCTPITISYHVFTPKDARRIILCAGSTWTGALPCSELGPSQVLHASRLTPEPIDT